MSFKVITGTLSAALAAAGTFTVAYPAGTDSGSFTNSFGHFLVTSTNDKFISPTYFSLTFGTSDITVTWATGAPTLALGTAYWLQIEQAGPDSGSTSYNQSYAPNNTVASGIVLVSLGAPDILDADGVSASQSVGAAGSFLINGALAAGGVATFDRPRNVVGAWTTNSIVSVTGTDEYGVVMNEKCASGATFTGKKAFKTITSVTSTAAITAATIGSGDVLGLPVYLEATAMVLREAEDGVAATAGTLVKADPAKPTATTGDVRGTYDPNSACDGAKSFQLVVVNIEPMTAGQAQFAA